MRREDLERKVTLCADKGYNAKAFVSTCKAFNIEAHVARNTAGHRSNIPAALAEYPEYKASQVVHKRVEEVFGWVRPSGSWRSGGTGVWPQWTGSSRVRCWRTTLPGFLICWRHRHEVSLDTWVSENGST